MALWSLLADPIDRLEGIVSCLASLIEAGATSLLLAAAWLQETADKSVLKMMGGMSTAMLMISVFIPIGLSMYDSILLPAAAAIHERKESGQTTGRALCGIFMNLLVAPLIILAAIFGWNFKGIDVLEATVGEANTTVTEGSISKCKPSQGLLLGLQAANAGVRTVSTDEQDSTLSAEPHNSPAALASEFKANMPPSTTSEHAIRRDEHAEPKVEANQPVYTTMRSAARLLGLIRNGPRTPLPRRDSDDHDVIVQRSVRQPTEEPGTVSDQEAWKTSCAAQRKEHANMVKKTFALRTVGASVEIVEPPRRKPPSRLPPSCAPPKQLPALTTSASRPEHFTLCDGALASVPNPTRVPSCCIELRPQMSPSKRSSKHVHPAPPPRGAHTHKRISQMGAVCDRSAARRTQQAPKVPKHVGFGGGMAQRPKSAEPATYSFANEGQASWSDTARKVDDPTKKRQQRIAPSLSRVSSRTAPSPLPLAPQPQPNQAPSSQCTLQPSCSQSPPPALPQHVRSITASSLDPSGSLGLRARLAHEQAWVDLPWDEDNDEEDASPRPNERPLVRLAPILDSIGKQVHVSSQLRRSLRSASAGELLQQASSERAVHVRSKSPLHESASDQQRETTGGKCSSTSSQQSTSSPPMLSRNKGWTSSKQVVKAGSSFQRVEDCILSRAELHQGREGGGGVRVRPIRLVEHAGESSSFNLSEESSWLRSY